VSVPARRRQVAYGRERGLSVRRACTLFAVARSALRYESRMAASDALVIERMRVLAAQYPRYGYRRIRIFLDRDGYRMSPGRAWRLWQTARPISRWHVDCYAIDANLAAAQKRGVRCGPKRAAKRVCCAASVIPTSTEIAADIEAGPVIGIGRSDRHVSSGCAR
jgi:hypothetical protein